MKPKKGKKKKNYYEYGKCTAVRTSWFSLLFMQEKRPYAEEALERKADYEKAMESYNENEVFSFLIRIFSLN